MAGLSISEETKIVALLARGDTHQQIMNNFPERQLSKTLITKVKKRNKSNLALIRERTLEKQEEDAMAIKEKANKLISKQLDHAEKEQEIVANAFIQYQDGKISLRDYMLLLKSLSKNVTELVSVSKEMHNQAETKPEGHTSAEDLAKLVEAIKSGDEIKLNQLVFNAKSDPPGPQDT